MALAFLLGSACHSIESAPGGVGVGRNDQPPPLKIIGGEPFDGLPAVGALTYDGSPFCTGTLIDARTVLTAGHCVEDGAARRMRFAIGPSAWEPEQEIEVASIEPHPGYDPDSLINDLGLVHLAEDAPMDPIALMDGLDEDWVGTEMLFVGYGMDDPDDEDGLGVKRAVTMPIESVSETELSFGGRAANICDGDSGSPVLYEQPEGEMLIAGVVSSGDEWCQQYGIAIRVDPYFDFLFGQLEDPCGGETYYGRCEGDTLIWCEEGTVQRVDCADLDAECGLYGEDGYYCLD